MRMLPHDASNLVALILFQPPGRLFSPWLWLLHNKSKKSSASVQFSGHEHILLGGQANFCGVKINSCSLPFLVSFKINFRSRLFFRKLKKDERWENRTRLVWGLQPTVTMLKKCKIFSGDSSVYCSPPKSTQNLLMIHL